MVLEVPLLCLTDGTLFKVHFEIERKENGTSRVAPKEPRDRNRAWTEASLGFRVLVGSQISLKELFEHA